MLLRMLYQSGCDELHMMHTPAQVAIQFQIHLSSNQHFLKNSVDGNNLNNKKYLSSFSV